MARRSENTKALRWLFRTSKKQLVPMVLLILGNTLLASTAALFALACRGVIDGAVAQDRQELIVYAAALLGIILAQFVLRLACRSLEERIKAKLEMLYKSGLFETLLQKGYSEVTQFHSGELLNRLTNDVVVVSEGVATLLPNLFSLLTRISCALGVLILFDRMFALVFVIGGALLFAVSRVFRGRMKRMHKQVQQKDGEVRSFLQEVLGSLAIVKVFDIQNRMLAKSEQIQQEHYRARMKRRTVGILANAGFGLIFQTGYLYALLWGAFRLFEGSMSFGSLTAVLQLVGQVQQPFANLSGFLPKYYSMIASAERIIEMEQLPDEAGASTRRDAAALYAGLRGICFENLTFRYDRETLFESADLQIDKYDFVAIEGISGIGKSTLLKLLLGLYPGYAGRIYLETDGEGEILADRSTRRLFGYVPQGNYLFSGTIRENITLIRPDATQEQIDEAIRISCAETFVRQLPQGLDTVIGEKGAGLSEGQVQRLAIARMLLSGASVLLLDEATSALDEQTEEQLLRNLRELRAYTLVIVSHKKAALSICNKRVRIVDQKIICSEEGCEPSPL